MRVLSIKVSIRKKSGNLSYAPRILYVTRKEGEREHASIDDCVETSIQGLEDCTKKSIEKTNYTASNNIGNFKPNRKNNKN